MRRTAADYAVYSRTADVIWLLAFILQRKEGGNAPQKTDKQTEEYLAYAFDPGRVMSVHPVRSTK
jgi:hypothetical protein